MGPKFGFLIFMKNWLMDCFCMKLKVDMIFWENFYWYVVAKKEQNVSKMRFDKISTKFFWLLHKARVWYYLKIDQTEDFWKNVLRFSKSEPEWDQSKFTLSII